MARTPRQKAASRRNLAKARAKSIASDIAINYIKDSMRLTNSFKSGFHYGVQRGKRVK